MNDMDGIYRSLGGLSLSEKLYIYAYYTQAVLNTAALFSDESANYVNPMEPDYGDEVSVMFRTARNNVEQVFFCTKGRREEMLIKRRDTAFDYYEFRFVMGREPVRYHFEIRTGDISCFYNKKGPGREADEFFDFCLTPGFSTPDWAKGAVFYQIFVDRFANGDKTNDVEDREYFYIDRHVHKVEDWSKKPEAMDVTNFYGGDLQGVLDHLDYLSDLGVEVLYLNPIFVSPSNHKYDTQDYDHIDPHYGKIVRHEGGLLEDWDQENRHALRYIHNVIDRENLDASNEFFIQFVEEVHKRGMKVVLDGVFNHCGSFNKWMDAERLYENQEGYENGAFISADSPYNSFFKFYSQEGWPYNSNYDGWWGHKTLPKLNYEESDTLCSYILRIAQKWVSPPYNADGWRLDVAADLGQSEEFNHEFWKRFRRAVKEANPNAIILAEHYEDPSSWLRGDEWDTVMNYNAFMEPVSWFLTGMEKHSDERRDSLMADPLAFRDAMIYHMSRFQFPSLVTAMNELSNHDHSRFLTRTNLTVGRTATVGADAADIGVNPAIMRTAVMLQMTWIGAPTVYYGDEAGLTGWTDPDSRRTYPWGAEDKKLIRYHQEMIEMHKSHRALVTGSIKFLPHGRHVIAYGRFDARQKLVILINGGYEDEVMDVPVWEIGVTNDMLMRQIVKTWKEGYSLAAEDYSVDYGSIHICVPGLGGIVLKAYTKI